MHRISIGNSGSVMVRALLSLLIVALFTLAIYASYSLQLSKVNNLNSQIKDLKAQLSRSAQLSAAGWVYTSNGGVQVKVYFPESGAKVTSPVALIGEVPGNWSFEAGFPVRLVDGAGNLVAQTSAHVLGDWTTDKSVPFSAQLTYNLAQKGNGKLILQKDNPSGLPKNDDSVTIPVTF